MTSNNFMEQLLEKKFSRYESQLNDKFNAMLCQMQKLKKSMIFLSNQYDDVVKENAEIKKNIVKMRKKTSYLNNN